MADKIGRPRILVTILLVIVVVLLLANIIVSGFLLKQGKAASNVPRRSLHCEAVPVRFILDEPACADKLLKAMNLTRVKVVPKRPSHVNKPSGSTVISS